MKIDENCFYYQGVTNTPQINFYHFSSSLIPLAEPLGGLDYLVYLRLRIQLEPQRNPMFSETKKQLKSRYANDSD